MIVNPVLLNFFLSLLLLKHIYGFHKIQILFSTLELKNKNEKYLKKYIFLLIKNNNNKKKLVKSGKEKRIG